ncbi:uncharacterized protein LOC101685187 [Mustela putorius furo]|uniref:Uncharacterized protein LOC101685187 n=1 Tax=Mustela putorius furo TaxID=9669 RepID=A0A8U0UZS3_MUSPF|nr:uncharacterized protein LOC101685187 [Mustela putorius furo]
MNSRPVAPHSARGPLRVPGQGHKRLLPSQQMELVGSPPVRPSLPRPVGATPLSLRLSLRHAARTCPWTVLRALSARRPRGSRWSPSPAPDGFPCVQSRQTQEGTAAHGSEGADPLRAPVQREAVPGAPANGPPRREAPGRTPRSGHAACSVLPPRGPSHRPPAHLSEQERGPGSGRLVQIPYPWVAHLCRTLATKVTYVSPWAAEVGPPGVL